MHPARTTPDGTPTSTKSFGKEGAQPERAAGVVLGPRETSNVEPARSRGDVGLATGEWGEPRRRPRGVGAEPATTCEADASNAHAKVALTLPAARSREGAARAPELTARSRGLVAVLLRVGAGGAPAYAWRRMTDAQGEQRLRITWDRAREITGYASPPPTVVQEQSDGFQGELRRLAWTPQEAITHEELWYYHHDLWRSELQPDLFAYLFPVCLMDWHATLLANRPCAYGDTEFHWGLWQGQVLDRMLDERQRAQLFAFFRDGFLDRIDQERGFRYVGSGTPAYAWMRRLGSIGFVMPDIAVVWDAWWALESPGAAVALIQWCSALMYREGENPLFGVWTASGGGGGPCPWEDDSFIYGAGWPPANVAFLREALGLFKIRDGLERALTKLRGEPEKERALAIVGDFPNRAGLVAKRAAELPDMLAAEEAPFGWPP